MEVPQMCEKLSTKDDVPAGKMYKKASLGLEYKNLPSPGFAAHFGLIGSVLWMDLCCMHIFEQDVTWLDDFEAEEELRSCGMTATSVFSVVP
eukprot:6070903-Amphidinium_carterae.3